MGFRAQGKGLPGNGYSTSPSGGTVLRSAGADGMSPRRRPIATPPDTTVPFAAATDPARGAVRDAARTKQEIEKEEEEEEKEEKEGVREGLLIVRCSQVRFC